MIKNTRTLSYQKLPDDPSVQPKYAAVAGHQKQDLSAAESLTLDKISALDEFLNPADTKDKTLYLKWDSTGTPRLSTHRPLWDRKQKAQDAVNFIYGLGYDGTTTEHTPAVQRRANKLFNLAKLGTVKKLKANAELCRCVRKLKQAMEEEAGGPSRTTFMIDNDPRASRHSDSASDTSSASSVQRVITSDQRLEYALNSYFG